MTDYKINSTEDFVKYFGKSFQYIKQESRFLLFLFIVTIGIFLFFFSFSLKYKNYDPYKAKPSEYYQKRIYEIIYAQSNKNPSKKTKRNEIRNRRETINRQSNTTTNISNDDYTALKLFTRKYESEDGKQLNNISTELASIDDLDKILNDFELNYKLEKNRERFLNRSQSNFLTPEILKANSAVKLDARKSEKLLDVLKISIRRETGYRSSSDLKEINLAIDKNNKAIIICYDKFKRIYSDLKGSVKVEFYVDTLGKIKKETLEVVETTIPHQDFIDCLLKNIKRFRNIPAASKNAQGDYLFTKKYLF
jgi:hypothetical protein